MTNIRQALDFILEKKFTQAEEIIFEHVKHVMRSRLDEVKKITAADRFAEIREASDYDDVLVEATDYDFGEGYKAVHNGSGYNVHHDVHGEVGETETSHKSVISHDYNAGMERHNSHHDAVKHLIKAHKGHLKESLTEAHKSNNVTKQGRTKLIKVRVRGGKVQRRKKVSAVKGFTLRGGKLTRMSSIEKRHRKMGARKAKIKRRSKKAQIHRKLVKSLRKRHQLGL